MTSNTPVSSTIALGDGVTAKFNFSFVGVNAAFIEVIFTDVAGTETVLARGAGSAQDQIVLNAPAVGATWGVGGVVPYAPNGVPIAAGNLAHDGPHAAIDPSGADQKNDSSGYPLATSGPS
ncbi:hypothetical protein ACVIGB_008977 [Bradyrhizobium sp. USDA 4341]